MFATRKLDDTSLLSASDQLTATAKMSDKEAVNVEDGVINAPQGEAVEVMHGWVGDRRSRNGACGSINEKLVVRDAWPKVAQGF